MDLSAELNRASLMFFVPLAAIFGTVTIVWSTVSLVQSVQASHWHPVRATVLKFDDGRPSESDGGTVYRPHVEYVYTVNGQVYDGDKIAPGGDVVSVHQDRFVLLKSRYQPNATVTAYFNPDEPDNSYLEPLAGFSDAYAGLSGGVISWLFVVFGIYFLRSSPQRQQAMSR